MPSRRRAKGLNNGDRIMGERRLDEVPGWKRRARVRVRQNRASLKTATAARELIPSALRRQLRRLFSSSGAGKFALEAMTRRQTTTGESKLERLESHDSRGKKPLSDCLQLCPTRATTVEKKDSTVAQQPSTNALGLTPVLHSAVGLDDTTRLLDSHLRTNMDPAHAR